MYSCESENIGNHTQFYTHETYTHTHTYTLAYKEKNYACSYVLTHTYGSVGEACSETERSKRLYHLIAVVQHLGDAYGGHYVCYRRYIIYSWVETARVLY